MFLNSKSAASLSGGERIFDGYACVQRCAMNWGIARENRRISHRQELLKMTRPDIGGYGRTP